jgi:ABC-type uncharacterized transport system substrate-binding protein
MVCLEETTLRRREFVKLLSGAATVWSFAAWAQQSAIPLIGVLHGVSAAQWTDRMVGFHRGLGEAGFAEGGNVTIEYRWAEGHFDRLPAMAADLVSRKVAVICARRRRRRHPGRDDGDKDNPDCIYDRLGPGARRVRP